MKKERLRVETASWFWQALLKEWCRDGGSMRSQGASRAWSLTITTTTGSKKRLQTNASNTIRMPKLACKWRAFHCPLVKSKRTDLLNDSNTCKPFQPQTPHDECCLIRISSGKPEIKSRLKVCPRIPFKPGPDKHRKLDLKCRIQESND